LDENETDFSFDIFLPHITTSRYFPSCSLHLVHSFYKRLLLVVYFKVYDFIFIGPCLVLATGVPASFAGIPLVDM